MTAIKTNYRDCDGNLWQIVETYSNSLARSYLDFVLYNQIRSLYEMRIWPIIFRTSQKYGQNEVAYLKNIWRPIFFDLFCGIINLRFSRTVLFFQLKKVQEMKDAHPLARTGSKYQICPHCRVEKNKNPCVERPFWDMFTLWEKTRSGKTLSVRRCEQSKGLYILEHSDEVFRVDKDGQNKCGNCGSVRLEKKPWPLICHCENCKFPLINDDGEFGEAAREQRMVLEEILNYMPTGSLKYDGRKINDLPFKPSDLRVHEADIFRQLRGEEWERMAPHRWVLNDEEQAFVMKICEEFVGTIHYDRNS